MIKADFVKAVYQKASMCSLKEAEKALEAVFDVLKGELAAGKDISVYGFGSFKVAKRAARKGRNPRTGKELRIPAAKVVKFSPAAALKRSVK